MESAVFSLASGVWSHIASMLCFGFLLFCRTLLSVGAAFAVVSGDGLDVPDIWRIIDDPDEDEFDVLRFIDRSVGSGVIAPHTVKGSAAAIWCGRFLRRCKRAKKRGISKHVQSVINKHNLDHATIPFDVLPADFTAKKP